MQNDPPHIVFRKHVISDAQIIWKLIQISLPLDLNSLYCYLILCAHFADTSVVSQSPEGICGYISAYIRPDRQNTLFVWQVVVKKTCQGQGVSKAMLKTILQSQYSVTVNPSNRASELVLELCGSRNNVIKFLAPLIIPDEVLHEGLDILDASIGQVLQ